MYKTPWLWGAAFLFAPFAASLTGGCGASAPDSGDATAALQETLSAASDALLPSATRPILSGINPRTASNRGGTPLLLTGRNFAAGATVKFGGALATSSVLSSTTIAVTLPAHPGQCGLVPVRVENPTGGGTVRSDLFSYQGEFGYRAPVQYPVVAYANEVAVADFNQDGRLDVVVSTMNDASPLSLLYGSGDGTFSAARNLTAGGLPLSVIAADFNHDGNPDLAVSDWSKTATGYVLLGNGHSVPGVPFRTPVAFTTLEDIGRIKSADVNADGKEDLLIVSDNSVGVLLGKGDGTFGKHLDISRTTRPWDITSGDLNGDGRADLVVASLSANTISVFLGRGDGTFLTGVDYAADKSPTFIAVADVNRDGKLDIVSGNARSLSVFLGKGDGTVAAARNYIATAHSLNDFALRDMDGDGQLDAVVVDELGNGINILLGSADGSFAAPQSFPSGVMPNYLGIGDFDGDHRPDIVSTSFTDPGSVAVMLRECM